MVVAPPRCSPFSLTISWSTSNMHETIKSFRVQVGIGDPDEYLDKFYAEIDWYDLSNVTHCNVFRTTLSKHALAWFNQLSVGTISNLEQLPQLTSP
ncbi:UNVERIFIED_CONTAM: hypothetical protein Slati_2893800 [Sesamum latifolium]|uniref:Retrotransposon gag domain-containing protein n=1 Tax=Sesamum latifolium TaxID=2727402 RepID=A0AAW2VE40_9LAMI